MNITAFLPCRSGSSRIKNKNIVPFADTQRCLFDIKLSQLLKSGIFTEIIVSTDDPVIIKKIAGNKSIKLDKVPILL